MTIVALDLETTGLDYWKPDFPITDLAISFQGKSGIISVHETDPEVIYKTLHSLMTKKATIIVHNYTFDIGVISTLYPDIKFTEVWDTMRLCQVGDAGSYQKKYCRRYKEQGGIPRDGLSLTACTSRWLHESYHNHKSQYYQYLRDKCGVLPGKEGENLQLLPPDLMKEYNSKDTEATLMLYTETLKQFNLDGYNGYISDHELYRSRCRQLIESFVDGVKVDREALQECISLMDNTLTQMETDFREVHKENIPKVIQIKTDAYINDPKIKTESGRDKRRRTIEEGLPFGQREKICEFNIGSYNDLFLLFSGVMGITTPFLTKPNKDGAGGGNPSFAKAHLPSWHESGKILQNRGTVRITKKQAESLLELSEFDGRWHISMQATGARTGRMSGSDGSRG